MTCSLLKLPELNSAGYAQLTLTADTSKREATPPIIAEGYAIVSLPYLFDHTE
jgi:hypothetical protein